MKQAPINSSARNVQTSPFEILVLSASAGGTAEINSILRNLPEDFSLPIIVMQPVVPKNTGIVEVYGQPLPFTVEWARSGSALAPRKVLVCPPGSFLELMPDGTCAVSPCEYGAVDKPIDRFLESVAHSFGERAIGVILTGVENDGALGARQLHFAGGCVLVQNDAEYTAMPSAAIQLGVADIVLPLDKIASVLVGLAWHTAQRTGEEKYRILFNSLEDSFELLEIIRDETGKPRDVRVLDVNQAYERQSGLRAKQVIGLRWNQIEPDIQPYWYEKVFKVAETGNPERYDVYNKKQGKIFDAYFCRFAHDKVGALFRDITKSKRTEEALRGSEEKYRTLFETMDDGFAVMELIRDENKRAIDLRYRELNSRFESITSLARENVIGRLMSEVVGIEEDWIYTYQTVVNTGEKVRFEHYVPALQRWFDVAVFSYGGNLFANIFHDITERKRAEEALRKSEEKYRTLFNSIDEGFYLCEVIFGTDNNPMDIHYLEENPAAIRVMGTSFVGKTFRQINPHYKESWYRTLGDMAIHGGSNRLEYYSDPDEKWFDIYITKVGDKNSHQIAVVFQDVTERKRAEEALRENKQQLQLLNETLEQKVQEKTAEVRHLASDLIKVTQRERQRISHILHDDLQQRIYAIQMQMSFLHDDLQNSNEAARREASDVEKELNDILKITRHLSIDLSPPILREEGLSHAISWLTARMWQQYGLPIELQADEPFVIANEDLHVLLFNCVRELLFNVVKHAEANRAGVVLRRSDAGLQIEVHDNGKGFSMTALEEKAGKDGLPLSLGLPSIRHQLSLFGGDMKINSEPGAGTRIILTVPVHETR